MAKTKKIVLDLTDSDFNGSKNNEIITLQGGAHKISTGKGNDKIIIDIPSALTDTSANPADVIMAQANYQKISTAKINILKGTGSTSLSVTSAAYKYSNDAHAQVPLPQIVFEAGAELTYSMELKNLSSFNKNAVKLYKYMGNQAELDVSTLPDDLKEFARSGANIYNLVITAKWGNKVSKVIIEDYFVAKDAESAPEINYCLGNSTQGSLKLCIEGLTPLDFSKELSTLNVNVVGLTYNSKALSALNKAAKNQIKALQQALNTAETDTERNKIQKRINMVYSQNFAYQTFPTSYRGLSEANNTFNINKTSMVTSSESNLVNTYNIGKKAKIVAVNSGKGEDNFNVDNLNNLLYIAESGVAGENTNNITIKNANGSDFHAVIAPTSLDFTDADEFLNYFSGILLQNSKGIKSLGTLDVDLSNKMSAESEILKCKGIYATISNRPNNIFNNEKGFLKANSKVEILGDPLKGAGTIEIDDIKGNIKSQFNLLKDWETDNITWLNSLQIGGTAMNIEGLMMSGNKIINLLIKENGIKGKKAIKQFKKEFRAKQAEVLAIYKSCYVGTSGNNSYTFDKQGGVVNSGYGNDTFTFKGKLSYSRLDKYGDPETRYTDIYSRSKATEADKIVFKNYSFENGDLRFAAGNSYWDLTFEAVDFDKNRKVAGSHQVYYQNINDNEDDTYNLTVQDKKRSYELSASLGINQINLNDDKNHIIFQYENSRPDTIAVTSNGKYNRMYFANTICYENNNKETHDYLDLAEGTDTIDIKQYNKNTTFTGVDYVKREIVESLDNNDQDIFKIQMSDSDLKNLRFVFNVSKGGGHDMSTLLFTDKSNLTASNICSNNDFEGGFALKKGISLQNFEDVRINGNSVANCRQVATSSFAYTSNNLIWLDTIIQNVQAWLNNTTYADANAVFNSGNEKDINSLLKVYKMTELNLN